MKKRSTVLFAALALLLVGIFPSQAQPKGGTFNLPINDDPQMWPVSAGVYNILVNKVLYSALVRYDLKTLAPVGDLADSWSVSPDGLTYTFILRQNVKWHDGEVFNADDVIFTINKVWRNPDVPFYLADNFRLIKDAKKVDDYTITISLSQPQAAFPVLLGYNAAILPKHLLSTLTAGQLANPTAFLRNPIGTGPFKFGEYRPGAFVILNRNDAYFGGVPELDSIVFRIVPDANSQLALLQSGELDLVIIEPFQIAAVEGNPAIKIQSVPIARHEFIAINNGGEHLSDVKVRRALAMGLDRKQLLEAVYRGRGKLATGPFVPAMAWAYDESIEPLPFDPVKAADLLDEAGWKMGANGVRTKDGQALSFSLLYDPSNPTRARVALIAQEEWRRLGIKIRFETSEYRAIVERLVQSPPKYQLNPNYLVTPPDPDGVANYYMSASKANYWAYKNSEVNNLLVSASATIDVSARAAIYKRIQAIIHEEQPVVFTVYPDEIQALSVAVEKFPEAGYREALSWAHLISKR